MHDFLGDEQLTTDQALIIVHAMWRVANIDQGVHERERAMIQEFIRATAAEEGTSLNTIDDRSWDGEAARKILDKTSLRELLVRSSFLVSFVDGKCSEKERALIDQMASDLGITPSRRDELENDVKKSLLQPFRSVETFRNVIYDVAKERLGLEPKEVDALFASESAPAS